MTDLLSELEAPSDAELISRVRGGDLGAYGELFSRHVGAANRLARQLVRGPDADDLVSEAFAKVLSVLQSGGGPDVAFRAYLLTAVRRLHVDRVRATTRVHSADDMAAFDPGVPFQDTAVAAFESGAAARAFASLPERWQLVLWHLEVEGQKPADIAPLLGMSPNSVSALAYRAREGLRQAFLTMHLNDIAETDCRWVNEHLGAYVRKGLAKREETKVRAHLDQCRRCTAIYLELTEVNSNLRALVAPLVLGGAAAAYLSSTGAGGTLGLGALVGRVRDTVAANAGVAATGAVAAGVAAAATATVLLLPSADEQVISADRPLAVTSAPAPAPVGPPDVVPGPGGDATPAESPSPAVTPAGGLALVPAVVEGADPAATPVADPTGSDLPQPGASPTGSTGPGPSPSEPPSPDPSESPSPGFSDSPEPSPSQLPEPSPSQVPDPTPGPSTDPTPSGSPTDPPEPDPTDGPPTVSDLTFAAPAHFDGSAVTFTVQGSPALPPTVRVDLADEPAGSGIAFAEGGDCTLEGPTAAVCPTADPLMAAPLLRRVAADAGRTFTARIPLDIPDGAPATRLTLTLSVPDGYDDPSGDDNVSWFHYSADDVPDPAREADVALGEEVEVATVGLQKYEVTTAVELPDDYTGPVIVTLGGAAKILAGVAEVVGNEPPVCEVAGDSVTCDRPTDDTFDLTLRVATDANPVAGTPITLTVAPGAGFTDPDGTNNTRTVTLPYFEEEPPEVDLTFTAPGEVAAEEPRVYQVEGEVTGVPPGYDGVVRFGLTAPGDPPTAWFAESQRTGCSPRNGGAVLECPDLRDGQVQLSIGVHDNSKDVVVRIELEPLTGRPDPTPNAVEVRLLAFRPGNR